MHKGSLSLRIIIFLLVGLTSAGCFRGERGPMGPPGMLTPGTVEGTVWLWKDGISLEEEAGGVEITLEGLPGYSGITATDGTYIITDVPSGIYTIVAQKEGYGTMKKYNFSVGGGTSYHLTDLYRIAQPPRSLTAERSTFDLGAEILTGVKISWVPADTTLWNLYWIYCSTDINFAEAISLGQIFTSRPSGVFLGDSELEAGDYYFGILAGNGVYYVDEKSGDLVFPSQSGLVSTTETVNIAGPDVQAKIARGLLPLLGELCNTYKDPVLPVSRF